MWLLLKYHDSEELGMPAVTTIGLDIAKSVFQVHGVDTYGNMIVRRQLKRRYVLPFFKKLPPCLVGIEACATSHHWSRELQARTSLSCHSQHAAFDHSLTTCSLFTANGTSSLVVAAGGTTTSSTMCATALPSPRAPTPSASPVRR